MYVAAMLKGHIFSNLYSESSPAASMHTLCEHEKLWH